MAPPKELILRPAALGDAEAVAPLLYAADQEVWDFIFAHGGATATAYLADAFRQGTGLWGPKTCAVAVLEKSVVGVAAVQTPAEYPALERQTFRHIRGYYGPLSAAQVVFRSLLVGRCMPPPKGDVVYLAALDEERLSRVRQARATARRRVWELADTPRRLILDLDATLVTAHSEKEGAAGTYKHGFGFHPLLCFEATRAEALAGILRPGNAGSNTASDHIEVLSRALLQLPAGAVNPGTLVRTDSAGATHAFTDAVHAEKLGFSVGFDLTEPVREAIRAVPESTWVAALDSDGGERDGAWVAELALDLKKTGWPRGTRAICRRERPHPGAQLSFTDENGYRFQVFITNQQGGRIARLEQIHRSRAAIEDSIRCAKASGLRNLPFRAYAHNAAWLELVLLGCDLVAFTKTLLLDAELATCEPKRLRYRLLHVAARIVSHARSITLRLPRGWPWADAIVRAFARLHALPAG